MSGIGTSLAFCGEAFRFLHALHILADAIGVEADGRVGDGEEEADGEEDEGGALHEDDNWHDESQQRHGLHAQSHPSEQVAATAVVVFVHGQLQLLVGLILHSEDVTLHQHVEH